MSLKTKTNNFINDDILLNRTALEGYYEYTTDLSDNSRDLTQATSGLVVSSGAGVTFAYDGTSFLIVS